ncbi:MSHA biogenesis protein MshN [Marinobacter sp. LV10R520-4]|uniref:tetratricopeptide repeat protein n=1 Tax=Marinobacter sp. LV10R520-4 TaxID=1761796 RepID=UPI000BF88437|nr:tetratricopeptide repeat protein [Marinobacter sp. LV10R520-4]PFG52120.1 MSHA biogenesis protein MshN [Marinobacter sp. LV10R520-4]
MSLVNDMLRDLEARRAAPTERLQLDGLHAVDETAVARRTQRRRGLIGLALLLLIGLGLWLLLARPDLSAPTPTVPDPTLAAESALVSSAAAPLAQSGLAADAPMLQPAQLLEVLPQHDGRGLILQLLLDRAVSYQRREENGTVSLYLPNVQLNGQLASDAHGRLQRGGRSLSWRVEAQGQGVQVLLVGLGDDLQVRDRLESAGTRWLLWIEVPIGSPALADGTSEYPNEYAHEDPYRDEAIDLNNLPVAEPATPRAAVQAQADKKAQALAELLGNANGRGPPQVSVAPSAPNALTQARQALQEGDYPRAIHVLEALQLTRKNDPEVSRWLARAYLAGGESARLLAWLPAHLAQRPRDSELRVLLARGQLQAGQAANAVATLQHYPPSLRQEPTYHALLAASYQQTGEWPQSAALYQQLIELQPQQSSWQLGLGIALEQLAQPAAAARHYRLAHQGPGLDEGARRFASERATALGARP